MVANANTVDDALELIRDNDPVIFMEHKGLYDLEWDVPEESYAIPFAAANIVREGSDATKHVDDAGSGEVEESDI